jgi:hypothetical protein
LDINAELVPRLATQNSFNFGLDVGRVLAILFKNICFLFDAALGTLNCTALNVNVK